MEEGVGSYVGRGLKVAALGVGWHWVAWDMSIALAFTAGRVEVGE